MNKPFRSPTDVIPPIRQGGPITTKIVPVNNPTKFQDATTTRADDWALVLKTLGDIGLGAAPFILLGFCLSVGGEIGKDIAIGIIGYLSKGGIDLLRQQSTNS